MSVSTGKLDGTPDIEKLHAEAIAEGYKDETCPKCQTVLLAHHHFIRCEAEDCPMKIKGGKSVLEMLCGAATPKPEGEAPNILRSKQK